MLSFRFDSIQDNTKGIILAVHRCGDLKSKWNN